jgi:hypothetical protein
MEGDSTMKILERRKLKKTIILAAGDQAVVSYREIDGVVRTERMTTLVMIDPPRSIRVNEALLVETLVDGVYAIGALLVETPDTSVELKQEAVRKVAVGPMKASDRHKKRPM